MTIPVARPRLVAAVLVVGEAAAVLVVGAAEVLAMSSHSVGLAVSSAVFFWIYGAGQLLGARALVRRQGWARGPLVFVQLIQLGVASGFRHEPTQALATVLALVALVALVCLLLPATGRELDDRSVGKEPVP